jgi:hypothetical protein
MAGRTIRKKGVRMSDSRENQPAGINVKAFERIDDSAAVQDYIHILDVFDGLAGIQRLKRAAIDQCRLGPGTSVLDAGCGTAVSSRGQPCEQRMSWS